MTLCVAFLVPVLVLFYFMCVWVIVKVADWSRFEIRTSYQLTMWSFCILSCFVISFVSISASRLRQWF